MPTFSTSFTPPPTLNLALEADLNSSAVRLSWNATAIPEVDFGGYRLERQVGDGDWEELVVYTDPDSVEYVDYRVPLNETANYRLTQFSIDAESGPADASTLIADRRWWFVVPGDDTLTFAIANIHQASMTRPKVQEEFSPMGRPGKVVVGDVVQAESGSLSFRILPDQPEQMSLIRRVQEKMTGELLVKAPDGGVHEVMIGTITRSFTKVPGWQEISLPLVGVA